MTVAPHVPDHHSLLPTVRETCTWLPRSYSGLSCLCRQLASARRCRESSEVVPPVRPEFRDSCSSRQMWLWHLSLVFFSKFAEGYLPHEAVVPDLPCALVVVVVSNGLPLDWSHFGSSHVHSSFVASVVKFCPLVCVGASILVDFCSAATQW